MTAVADRVTRASARDRAGVGGPVLLLGGLLVALGSVCLVAAAVGAYPIAPADVAGSVLRRLGLSVGTPLDGFAEEVLWQVRFPRIVLGVVVGGALGCAGAVMQGVFGNPLAEPGVVGVSSGAAVGAALSIVVGAGAIGVWATPLAAFVAGLVTTLAVYAMSRRDGRAEVVTLVLTGIAVNALCGAAIGLLTFVSDDAELRSITFWNLGSLGTATWRSVGVVTPLVVASVAMACVVARRLDLLALGEDGARHLGVDVERLRLAMIALVALMTSAAVAVTGVIQFVGLVVPHAIRLVAGPGHRLLLPASVLGGALVLVAADLVARTVAAPAEVPLGVLTALVGAPVFLWLLRRTRARQGGWA